MSSLSAAPIAVEKERSLHKVDWWLLLSAAILIVFGLMSLFSLRDSLPGDHFKKQIVWIAVGMIPFALFYTVHPKVWQKLSHWLYGLNLALLMMVLAFGVEKNGAVRWIEVGGVQFQPSEMAKLLVALTVSAFWANRIDEVHKLSTFLFSLAYVAPPLFLVHKQHQLGATLALFVTWLAVCVGAGVRLRYVFSLVFLAMAAVGAAYLLGGLSQYQKNRIDAWLFNDPAHDKTIGYQVSRAEVAFGAGGVLGEGFGNGEQKKGGFIPEQENDFVFTVIGEEGGLVGATLVLAGYGFFFYRAWLVMFRATDPFYKMASAGMLGMLAFHAVVNMGMNLRLFPVVGQWLPFMSYGGTAMWLCMCCVALLLNFRRHERPVLF